MQLRSSIAVALAQAGSYSSNWTPGLGTSICYGAALKRPKKKKIRINDIQKKSIKNKILRYWRSSKEQKLTLLTVARTWKQPKSPSTEDWIKKMWRCGTDGILLSH